MKTSPTTDLQSALDKCRSIGGTLSKEEKLVSDSAAELKELETSADLHSASALGQLSRLQTIVHFGPRRLESRRTEFEEVCEALLDQGHTFATSVLAPRCREMETKALDKVESELKPHYSDPEALRRVAYQSTTLMALAPITAKAKIDVYAPDGAVKFAERLLDAWGALQSFEKQYLG